MSKPRYDPVWLKRIYAERARDFTPKHQYASIELVVEPHEIVTVRIHAGQLRALRDLCAGMSDEDIFQTLVDEMLARYGVKAKAP